MRARLGDAEIYDAGDLRIEPGFVPDPDPRAKNAGRIAEFLPRERDAVHAAVGGNPDARLILLGGDLHGPRGGDGRSP